MVLGRPLDCKGCKCTLIPGKNNTVNIIVIDRGVLKSSYKREKDACGMNSVIICTKASMCKSVFLHVPYLFPVLIPHTIQLARGVIT